MLFDEEELFRVLHESGTRVLLIGRRAMIALGLPVLTADDDLWLHIDDIERLNACARELDLFPNYPADAARARGRYVLENSERVDVLVARRVSTKQDPSGHVTFDDVWSRWSGERPRRTRVPLSASEWARLAAIPVTEEEAEEIRSLVAWFKGRYPSVKARMTYARRKYDEVTRRDGKAPR